MVRYFTGNFVHRVDPKGRVSLPASYRKVLESHDSDHVVIIPQCERPEAHAGLSQRGYERLIEDFEEAELSPEDEEEMSVRLIADARHVPVDDAGRILLPKELREAIGIDREVAFVGRASSFEIWNPETWERHRKKVRERSGEGGERRVRLRLRKLHR